MNKEAKAEKLAQMTKIKDVCKAENRDLSNEERTIWERLVSELEEEGRSVMDSEKKSTAGLGDLGRYFAGGVDALSSEKRTWLTSAASSIISEHIQDQIFYDLLAQNDLRNAGTQFIKLKPNSRIPKITTYPDVAWQVEGSAVTPDASLAITGLSFADYNLTSIVKISQQLLQEADGRSEKAIQGAVSMAFNDETLRMMFSGAGPGSNQPLGLDGASGVQTVAGGSAVLTSYDLIIDAVKKLLDQNIPIENVAVFAPPVVWSQLAKSKTGLTSDKTALAVPPAIAGIRRYVTSSILETYGGGTNETRVYVGDFTKAVVGISGDFMLKSDHRYADEFNSAFFFLTRLDIQFLKTNAFCIIENIATA